MRKLQTVTDVVAALQKENGEFTTTDQEAADKLANGFWATICKTVSRMLSDRSVLSVCLPCRSVSLVYCGQTFGWIKMKLGTQVGLGPGHIVLDEDPAPLPKKGASPLRNFRPMSIVAKRLDGSRWHLARR